MSITLLTETRSALKELRGLREAVDTQSRMLPDCTSSYLVPSARPGSAKEQYYLHKKGLSDREYLGIDGSAAVNKIKTARYFKKLLQVIDKDIKMLERINKDYVIPGHKSINDRLPKTYRLDVPPAVFHASQEAAEWKKQKEAEKAKYEPYRPEELKFRARDGTMMRSLSEVTIANYLLSLGITFVYELPYTHNGKRIRPDFTILSPIDSKTVIIIEHQGAIGSEDYNGKFIRTLTFYLGTTLVPNKDVFFTFSHLNGNLDLRQIDCILRIAFGIEPSDPALLISI